MGRPWLIGGSVLLLTVLVHGGYYYIVQPVPECGADAGVMWKATEPRPPPLSPAAAVTRRYFGNRLYLMGLSYGLALGFTAYAAARTRGARRAGTAGVVGGMTLTGVLAALGCFLLGCCGSPMLTVYVAMFGSALVGFQDIFVFGFTLASVLVGFLWLRRCCGAAAACGPDCACHLPGADAEWVVAATDGAQAPVGAGPGGWLSASVQLEADAPADWGSVARAYLELLHGTLRLGGDRQAHVKLLLTTPSGALVANLAGVAGEPVFRGDAGAVAPSASLVVSTRAELAPEALRQVLESTLAEVLGTRFRGRIVRLQSLRANQPGAAGLPA